MGKNKYITKEKIRRYLYEFNKLDKHIRARELRWILEKGPSLQEWQERKNTVEEQVIHLLEDKKLQELKFYKRHLDTYLNIMKLTSKEEYRYLIENYIMKGNKPLKRIYTKQDKEIIEYLYQNLCKELEQLAKKNKKHYM